MANLPAGDPHPLPCPPTPTPRHTRAHACTHARMFARTHQAQRVASGHTSCVCGCNVFRFPLDALTNRIQAVLQWATTLPARLSRGPCMHHWSCRGPGARGRGGGGTGPGLGRTALGGAKAGAGAKGREGEGTAPRWAGMVRGSWGQAAGHESCVCVHGAGGRREGGSGRASSWHAPDGLASNARLLSCSAAAGGFLTCPPRPCIGRGRRSTSMGSSTEDATS